MNSAARLDALRARLAVSEPDALLVTGVSNVVYLTGFDGVFDEGANAASLVTEHTARVYTDSRYAEAAQVAASGTVWTVAVTSEPVEARACEDLAAEGVGVLGFESSLPYSRYRRLSECAGTGLVPTDQWVEELRAVKEPAEIERIERAAALTDRAFDHILGVLRPGMTEAEVALEIESFMRKRGSEGVAFPSIVASGPNSSRPHATVTDREIRPGDPVTMDFGARVGGYCADMTRSVVVGRASEEFRRVYEAVRAAQAAGKEAVRAGAQGKEIDRAAREVLGGAGLADHFGHGLGHGVGLDVHELPTLSPKGMARVGEGAVVTVEPGVYLEGRFGVRIEDLVTVERDGCRTLTTSPLGLVEV